MPEKKTLCPNCGSDSFVSGSRRGVKSVTRPGSRLPEKVNVVDSYEQCVRCGYVDSDELKQSEVKGA